MGYGEHMAWYNFLLFPGIFYLTIYKIVNDQMNPGDVTVSRSITQCLTIDGIVLQILKLARGMKAAVLTAFTFSRL